MQLLAGYLFATKKEHRVHLVICAAIHGPGTTDGAKSPDRFGHDRKAGRPPGGHAADDGRHIATLGC